MILGISPPLLVVRLLSSESTSLHAAPYLGETKYFFLRLLLVFIPVTPLPHYCQLDG